MNIKFTNTQEAHCFQLLKESNCQSVLNIGFRKGSREQIKDALAEIGCSFSIVEVFEPFYKKIKSVQGVKDLFNINVKDIKKLGLVWDGIIWLHGPEHLAWEDFLSVRKEIEDCCNKIVIYQAPIGHCPQGELEGNPYEKHLSTLTPDMFNELGYQTKYPLETTFSAWKIFNK